MAAGGCWWLLLDVVAAVVVGGVVVVGVVVVVRFSFFLQLLFQISSQTGAWEILRRIYESPKIVHGNTSQIPILDVLLHLNSLNYI